MKNRILVTVWTCPEWDQALVLEGSSQKTRKIAAGYRATGSRARLKHRRDYMTRGQIDSMPEHTG